MLPRPTRLNLRDRASASRPTVTAAVLALAVILAGCGSGSRQNASQPSGDYTVQVPRPRFPASQKLSEYTDLVIAVRNAGTKTIPDVAVTIADPALAFPSSAAAFGSNLNLPGVAGHSRAAWIVERGPGRCGHGCRAGGQGVVVSASGKTWALGALKPGATARFDWSLSAVEPGAHVIRYRVAAGRNGKTKAQLAGGAPPIGTLRVTISGKPLQSRVNSRGQIVSAP